MAKSKARYETSRSSKLRRQLRSRIEARLEELDITRTDAAELMGLSISQLSRLCSGHDLFSLDRLADAAARIGLTVEIRAVRPYTKR